MADLTVTASQVSLVYASRAIIFDKIAAVAITAGQVVYLDTNGKAALADASAAGTATAIGVALHSCGAGQAVAILKVGHLAGVNVSALAYGASVYLSDTNTGIMADEAGTNSKRLGRVDALPDTNGSGGVPTKVLFVELAW